METDEAILDYITKVSCEFLIDIILLPFFFVFFFILLRCKQI